MKKLTDLRLADWQEIAKEQGIDTESLTTNELIQAIGDKVGVTMSGTDKAAKTEFKKDVYDALLSKDAIEVDSIEDLEEPSDAPKEVKAKKDPLDKLSANELQSLAAKEGINAAHYTDKEDIIRFINSVRALRNKAAENQQEKTAKAQADKERGLHGTQTRVIDEAASFDALCQNVCKSFSTGIYGRRKPTVGDIKSYMDKSSHGFDNLKIVEKDNKKDGKYIVLSAKVKKEKLESEKILVD